LAFHLILAKENNMADEESALVEPDPELDALAHNIIGAAIEVHRRLGPGLDESLYEQALAIEFRLRGINFARQVILPVYYRDEPIGEKRLDLVVEGKLVVELKAVEQLAPVHKAQLLTYLKLSGHKLGLLINFNVPVLKEGIKRIIRNG
jgi:GxxExxY protein